MAENTHTTEGVSSQKKQLSGQTQSTQEADPTGTK